MIILMQILIRKISPLSTLFSGKRRYCSLSLGCILRNWQVLSQKVIHLLNEVLAQRCPKLLRRIIFTNLLSS